MRLFTDIAHTILVCVMDEYFFWATHTPTDSGTAYILTRHSVSHSEPLPVWRTFNRKRKLLERINARAY